MPPCEPWTLDLACCEMPDEADQDLIDSQLAIASELLWAASGRRIGPCEVTIRPCLESCGGGSMEPVRVNGAWVNRWCGCGTTCSCASLCRVWLPGYGGGDVTVTLDGVTLDPSEYTLLVDQHLTYLVRGDGCWPTCQDLTVACDAEGSFCVTYSRGAPLSDAAVAAVSELTCELVKACIPGCDCRLPRNIQSQTRQGISIVYDTSQSWLRALPTVALFLDAVNPNNLASTPTIWSPDIPLPVEVVEADGS